MLAYWSFRPHDEKLLPKCSWNPVWGGVKEKPIYKFFPKSHRHWWAGWLRHRLMARVYIGRAWIRVKLTCCFLAVPPFSFCCALITKLPRCRFSFHFFIIRWWPEGTILAPMPCVLTIFLAIDRHSWTSFNQIYAPSLSSIIQKSYRMTQVNYPQYENKGLAKEETRKMSPFYAEGDRKLVGEPVNKSMAKKSCNLWVFHLQVTTGNHIQESKDGYLRDVHKIINFVKLNNPGPGQSPHGQRGCPMSIMLTCITLFVIFRKRKLSEDKLFFQGSRLDKIVFWSGHWRHF